MSYQFIFAPKNIKLCPGRKYTQGDEKMSLWIVWCNIYNVLVDVLRAHYYVKSFRKTMVTFFVVLIAILAVFAAVILRMYFNQTVPKGLPTDQLHKLRTLGVFFKFIGIVAYIASRLGIGNLLDNIRHIHSSLNRLKKVPEETSLQIEDLEIANVPVRVYRPKQIQGDGTKLTGVVYLHGGGWILGSIDMYHSFNQNMAKKAGVVVVSVGYRLAPEHPFPAGFDDCYAVAKTLIGTGDQYGINTDRIVIAGDSAGGNLAAAVTHHLRNENRTPAGQILLYPALQFMDFSLPSHENHSSPVLSRKDMVGAWSVYLTGTRRMYRPFLAHNHSRHLHNTKYSKFIGVCENDTHEDQKGPQGEIPQNILDALTDYRVAPLMTDDMTGMPKTLLITGEFDVLRDDGVLYKKRLEEAGVDVTHCEYKTYHGFMLFKSVAEMCDSVDENITKFLKEL